MKNFLLGTMLILLLAVGCSKKETSCTPVPPEQEETTIKAYAASHGINAVKHSSGLYYEILDYGTGTSATVNSKVYISYTGKLLNDNTFDGTSNPSATGWRLSNLIEGWQIGIPLIQKGGRIKLIIPSALAYGCNGSGSIGANQILFFDITLYDVQ